MYVFQFLSVFKKGSTAMKNKKHKLEFPHVLILLIAVILICTILTYIIPAGTYDYETVDDVEMVVPDSYHSVERTPVTLLGFFSAVPEGMMAAAQIIFFIFIIAGSFNVLQETGAIEAALHRLAKITGSKSHLIIPIVMFALSMGGSCFGMGEETIVFLPIMISLAIALGYDSLTGTGIVFLGTCSGFAAAFMNPFNVGVAQGIAELPIYSGFGLRVVMFSVTTLVSIIFVLRYAAKVKKNPSLSTMYEYDKTRDISINLSEERPFTIRQKCVLLVAVAAIILIIVGVISLGWYLTEIAAIFFAMGLVGGLVGGMSLNQYASAVIRGMSSVTEGAVVVGVARGILVVLENGNIIGTILFYAANALEDLPATVTAEGMYIFQSLLSFIIPSGSGQAAVTIPIMTPLADLVGVTRQTMVLGFQMADGISELLTPTAGWFMAGLSLAKVPYTKWIKFAIPCLLLWYLIGFIFVAYAQMTGYGPM